MFRFIWKILIYRFLLKRFWPLAVLLFIANRLRGSSDRRETPRGVPATRQRGLRL